MDQNKNDFSKVYLRLHCPEYLQQWSILLTAQLVSYSSTAAQTGWGYSLGLMFIASYFNNSVYAFTLNCSAGNPPRLTAYKLS